MNLGTQVEHAEYGIGRVKANCDNPNFVQVNFKKEPPKPWEGYIFNVNPFVVPVNSLKILKQGCGIYKGFEEKAHYERAIKPKEIKKEEHSYIDEIVGMENEI